MTERQVRVCLGLGVALGLGLAVVQLLGGGSASETALPAGAVAVVNGVPIRAEAYQRAVAALAADRRTPLTDADRRRVLERLVEEELLVQRGLEMGLAQVDRRIRGDIVASMLDAIAAEAQAEEPDRDAVERFYRENADYFASPGRLHVRQVFVRVGAARTDAEALARAHEATRRLRSGEPLERVRDSLGDPELPPLPDGLLPPAKLRDYLGPTALRTALALEPGAVSDPVRSAAGYHVLVLVAREARWTPPLEEIEAQVRAEMRRRAGEAALRAYLERLERESEVRMAETLP